MTSDQDSLKRILEIEAQSESVRLEILQQLVSLHTASTAIVSKLDLKEVLDTVTREMTQILNAKSCALSEWDHEKDILKTLSEHWPEDWGEVELDTDEYPLTKYPFAAKVLHEKKEAQLFASQPDIDPKEYKLMDRFEMKSILLLPLVFQERVIGLVELYDEDEREYTDQEIIIAKFLANLAAIAIENAKLFTDTIRSYEEQMALRSSALVISSTLDLSKTLTQIAVQICQLLDATSAYISRYHIETKSSRVVAEYYSEHASEKERVSDMGVVYDHSKEMQQVDKLLASGEPDVYHINDPDLDGTTQAYLERYGGKSVLEIPIKIGEDFSAFVEVWETRHKRIFTENEISLCQAFATQAAIAIDNAQLFEMTQQEIQRRERIEEKLQYDALHDTLTDLPNRTLFLDRLGHVMARSKRLKDEEFAVLYVDLDKFKIINDSLGHPAGDDVLVRISLLIKEAVREIDTVSRYGGDEFLVLLESIKGVEEAIAVSDRIREKINTPMTIRDREVLISASSGIVMNASEYENPEEYIRDADIAMYHVKMNDKGQHQVFNPEMRSSFFKRLTLESDLRRAIDNEEFTLVYQPILSLTNRHIIGFEALLRWETHALGSIYPNEFIPLAEETGLIVELGYWVIRQACKQIVLWQKKYPQDPPMAISVNISSKQLAHKDFTRIVEETIADIGLAPESLILEITESVFIGETMVAGETLKTVRDLGIRVHLDDFGTGYSALSYIDEFPVDAIKIARSFVTSFNPFEKKRGLVHTIVSMAQDFGLEVVAEGIETPEQALKLGDIGCQYGQGFNFTPGKSPEDLVEFIEEYKK
ncbi:MAG: EAL domain-containing protein [Anaerolineales bacterium]|nr:MAG: EAL domain-containing protein [Anaerolineales bacterium]